MLFINNLAKSCCDLRKCNLMQKTAVERVYGAFAEDIRSMADLQSVGALLSWDQEIYIPDKAHAARARQRAVMSGLLHDRIVSDELWDRIEVLSGEDTAGVLSAEQRANVRVVKRSAQRARKIPRELVQEITRESAMAHSIWVEAREKSDFSFFCPSLKKLIELSRKIIDCVGYRACPYDALLDEYEEGLCSAQLDILFEELKKGLAPLIKKMPPEEKGGCGLGGKGSEGKETPVFEIGRQKLLVRRLVELMGFDFARGRMDDTVHPFCTGIQHDDVRLALRWHQKDIMEAVSGAMHEAGHGLYEQGFLKEHEGMPMGQAVSYGIHESQSRLWENRVGRSLEFCRFLVPFLKEYFPKEMDGVTAESFYGKINRARPSLIRVGADELTYNMHIIVRYELESAVFNKGFCAEDLPAAWNEKMKEYLGVIPPDDRHGVLQDVHWSMAGFGYFPTYTLGNIYASQIFNAAAGSIPELSALIEKGELLPLKEWLGKNIHQKGCLVPASELVRNVTGRLPDSSFFIDDMKKKYGII